jgi:hypothetical protein
MPYDLTEGEDEPDSSLCRSQNPTLDTEGNFVTCQRPLGHYGVHQSGSVAWEPRHRDVPGRSQSPQHVDEEKVVVWSSEDWKRRMDNAAQEMVEAAETFSSGTRTALEQLSAALNELGKER